MAASSELSNYFETSALIFFVNGKKVVELCPEPEQTLLSYLRDRLRLCGTKLGCGEGGCGACTVMLSKVDRRTNEIIHLSVNACLTPVCSVHGMAVTTVEGIGSTKTRLHPVQERIAKAHGSQCGFCTPGIVMSMYSLLRSMPKPSMKDLDIAFQGNLCRCTGYRPILDGYRTFIEETSVNDCAMGKQCCKNGGSGCGTNGILASKLFEPNEFTPLDPSQEPIFPPELKLSDVLDSKSVVFKGSRVTWYRPTKLKDTLLIKKYYPDAKIIVGNTEVGVEVKFKNFHYPILVLPSQVAEMTEFEDTGFGLKIGASATLDSMEKTMQKQITSLPEHETRLFKSIVAMLHWFAGKQIRNTASVGGNIMTASPISDLNPIFTAADIELEVQSVDRGLRKVKMGNDFFTGYRKNVIQSDEILINICIPRSKSNQYFTAYKQAKRRDDDIAIVTAAFNLTFEENTDIVEAVHMSFGGMAPTTVLATKSAEKMIGRKFSKELIEEVNSCLVEELDLSPSAPGGMAMYRKSLTLSLLFKTYLKISQQLEKSVKDRMPIPNNERSGAATFHTLPPKTSQLYEIRAVDSAFDKVGAPEVHASAFKQATGEAVYCDDMPKIENELYLSFVLSTKAHAKIVSIDASAALKLEGVHAFYSGDDIQDKNNCVGAVFHDEQVFAKKIVTCQGQTLGVVVADNQSLAQRASRLVKVTYEDIKPIIITIEDAIKNNSYFPGYPKVITSGDTIAAFKNADHVVEGECRMGGQEHFYLETQVAYAIPREGDELEIFCSSQHPSLLQKLTSLVLGIPAAKIVARVKRLGGGFGGKESRSYLTALPVAFAAYHLKKPVRCMLDRDEDMIMTGTRHPFLFKYKIAFSNDGIITGCEVDMYNNAGYSIDLSFSVLDSAMYQFANSYFIKNILVRGWVCRSNLPSNTAFRGFGAPQGMFVGEHMIRDVARITGKDAVQIATMNMMREGQLTHYQQKMENCNISRCWDQCITGSQFYKRRQLVNEFNKENRWRKRGISMVPTTFGISFGILHLEQGGALVHVYIDGSVLVSHGGTEMGQGLHTKMIQVASKTLNIPMDKIHISETSTDKVPNTSPTAASVSSDINGMALMNACQAILERLKSYQEKYPEENWDSWINRAYFDRVSLSATGFYATPNVANENPNGNYYNYYSYGAACSEVEIDCLTGDHQVIRTDIVMDVGSSLNPAIDIGQIEGGFMQGYGLYTLEELIYSPTGQLYSKGPGMYKIPGFSDIPAEFNVSLLTGASNPRAVYSSKAIGEPPLFLASSIFFGIKEAISAARAEEDLPTDYNFKSPATSERIRMACQDNITEKMEQPKKDSFIPWNVMV